MPVLRTPAAEPVVLPLIARHPSTPIRKSFDQVDAPTLKRIEQLFTACHLISVEVRKVRSELHRQGVRFPELIEYVLSDMDDKLDTLKMILTKDQLISAQDANNPQGRVDPGSEAGNDTAEDGRPKEV